MAVLGPVSLPHGEWVEIPVVIANRKWQLVVSIFIGILLFGLLRNYYALNFELYKSLYLLLLIIPITPIHELLHIVCFPSIRGTKVVFNLTQLTFEVKNNSIFTKSRLLISLLLPLIVLTVIPVLIAGWHQILFLEYLSLINVLGSGGDILSFITIVRSKNRFFTIRDDKVFAKK